MLSLTPPINSTVRNKNSYSNEATLMISNPLPIVFISAFCAVSYSFKLQYRTQKITHTYEATLMIRNPLPIVMNSAFCADSYSFKQQYRTQQITHTYEATLKIWKPLFLTAAVLLYPYPRSSTSTLNN